MQTATIETVITILDSTYPTIAMHEVHGHDPFQLLVAVILSQRSRDSVTVPTAAKLFEVAKTPADFLWLPVEELEKLIHAIGFYHEKAVAIKKLSKVLIEQYGGHVPSTEKELLSLPHVGRKTANIILTTFFNTPQIAVDIHVHRITNRLGWVRTGFSTLSSSRRQRSAPASGIHATLPSPIRRGTQGEVTFDDSARAVHETERALTKLIPKDLHSIVNRVFVAHGQTICLPRNPKCSICPVEKYCQKIGVSFIPSQTQDASQSTSSASTRGTEPANQK